MNALVLPVACAVVWLVGCGAGAPTGTDGGGTDAGKTTDAGAMDDAPDAAPDGPTPGGIHGAFTVIAQGVPRSYLYTPQAGNLVFCNLYPNQGNYLWARFAEQTASQGDNGPHVDIDVCAYDGAGSYAPMDAAGSGMCGAKKEFDVWWHDPPRAYANGPSPSPCSLTLSSSGKTLEGKFECAPLAGQAPTTGSVAIQAGTFRCDVVTM